MDYVYHPVFYHGSLESAPVAKRGHGAGVHLSRHKNSQPARLVEAYRFSQELKPDNLLLKTPHGRS